jgi:hypothetical protein
MPLTIKTIHNVYSFPYGLCIEMSIFTDEYEVMPLSQGSDEGFGSDPKTPISFTGLLNRSGSMTPSQRLWQNENIPR